MYSADMNRSFCSVMLWSGVLSLLLGGGLASGQTPAGQPLLKLTAPDFEKHIAVTSHQVTASLSDVPASPGIVVVCQPGKDGYPGITLTPQSGSAWDLSAFGHIDVRVVNTGAKKVTLTTSRWSRALPRLDACCLATPGERKAMRSNQTPSFGF
jgi:hypothetical protein